MKRNTLQLPSLHEIMRFMDDSLIMENQVDLSNFTTLRIGGPAAHFVDVHSSQQIFQVVDFAHTHSLPLVVIGEGSNSIFTDKGFDGVVVRMRNDDFTFSIEGNTATITAGAGLNWDRLVQMSVEKNLTGIEALSHIPGSVGAAPVQNIGAYGQELSDTLLSVDVYDVEEHEVRTFLKHECDFSYRHSRFKENPGRFIIISVTLELIVGEMEGELYRSLDQYFNEHSITDRKPQTIRDALYEIRWSKLPKPEELPNAGSFFKNAIINKEDYEDLLLDYPNLPSFPYSEVHVKIPAGWLLEYVGIKGECIGPICSYEKQSLVATNPDAKGNFDDLMNYKKTIIEQVRDEFGITLEQEPIIIY